MRFLESYRERSHRGLVLGFGEAVWSRGHRGFESRPLRQLGNVFVGSPSARARQPFLSENWNFLSFKMKFEPIFFRNARIS